MATNIGSQQELSKSADTTLYKALLNGGEDAASYIGFLVFQATGDVQNGLSAQQAVLEGSFKVSTSQVSAQTKSLVEAQTTTDIKGEPTAKIVIGGQEYDISSILQSTVYYWDQGNAKNPNYHLREVFTGLGDNAPQNYDPHWGQPEAPANHAPVTTPDSAQTDEDTPVDGDLRGHASDDDDDDLTYVLTDADGNQIAAPDGLTWNGDGTWSFDPSGRYEYLNVDQVANFIFYYKVNDGTDDSNVSSVTVRINGVNDAPTAEAINVTATETESHYNPSHQIENQNLPSDSDPLVVDLLETAFDPDNTLLSVGSFKFFDANGEIDQPAFITIDGTTLTIEQNHPELNDLKEGKHLLLRVTYAISDGDAECENTVNIDITGTKDQYTGTGVASDPGAGPFVDNGNNMKWNFAFDVPDADPNNPDNFDFSGKLKVNGYGDFSHDNEIVTVVAEGNTGLFFNNAPAPKNDNHGPLTVSGEIELTNVAFADGKITGTVELDNAVGNGGFGNGSIVTLELEYSYWA